MYVVKILKRKDASSLVVGVVVAMLVLQFIAQVSLELGSRISMWQWSKSAGNGFYPAGGWRSTYLQPFVTLLVQLVFLEALVWVYVWLHKAVSNKR